MQIGYLLYSPGLSKPNCSHAEPQTALKFPILEKDNITGLKDYRPVALISVIMKTFEQLILAHLMSISDSLLDHLQFAIYSLPKMP